MSNTQNIIYVATEGIIEFSSTYFENKDEVLQRKMDKGAHIVGSAISFPDIVWIFPPPLSENIETVEVTTGLSFDWSPWNCVVHGFGMKSSKTLNDERPNIPSLTTCSNDRRRSNCSVKTLPKRNIVQINYVIPLRREYSRGKMPREQEAKASPPQHSTAATAFEVHSRSHFPAFRRQQVENQPKVCKGNDGQLKK